jgi:hypothetical protein
MCASGSSSPPLFTSGLLTGIWFAAVLRVFRFGRYIYKVWCVSLACSLASSARLKKSIIRLLKEDEEFRYTVAGLIGLDEVLKRFDRYDDLFAKVLRRMEKHSEEIVKLRKEMVAGFRRHDELLAKHSEELVRLREDLMRGFELVEKRVSAVGARWGLMAEEAFREGLRGVLERDFGVRVERWRAFDDEGVVYGRPSDVEVDVAVSDGRVLLVEVSSHVRRSDISLFKRKAAFYERRCGRVPDRLVVVTPYADQDAVELAAALGIEVHTRV